jgi:5-methylthioribose kinase
MMATATYPEGYRILDEAGVRAFLGSLAAIAQRLGGTPADWRIAEVGDGNLNLVFIVDGPCGSACVKQAVPYVRVAGPSWPMTLERARFETEYLRCVAPHVGGAMPELLHYDPRLYCIVMERLAPHVILRQGLMAGRRHPRVGRDLGDFVARACFFTSDFAQPFEQKLAGVARFAANQDLLRISVDLIFVDPYVDSPRNRHTSPQLDAAAADLRADPEVKAAVARFGRKFLTESQALLHGDLHTGSVMATAADSRIIDPEFAFYGPIGFDLGAFLGNLLMSWYSQPGHALRGEDRGAQRIHILEQAKSFWDTFHDQFLTLWREQGRGDAYPRILFAASGDAQVLERLRREFMDTLFADMIGFAACKIIRRILGFAHVADFERIEDPAMRARCEASALRLARWFLTRPQDFSRIDHVLEAAPRMAD